MHKVWNQLSTRSNMTALTDMALKELNIIYVDISLITTVIFQDSGHKARKSAILLIIF